MMPEAREKSKNKPILNTYYMYLFMNNLDGFDLVLAIEFRIGSHSFHFVSFRFFLSTQMESQTGLR